MSCRSFLSIRAIRPLEANTVAKWRRKDGNSCEKATGGIPVATEFMELDHEKINPSRCRTRARTHARTRARTELAQPRSPAARVQHGLQPGQAVFEQQLLLLELLQLRVHDRIGNPHSCAQCITLVVELRMC